MLLGISEYCIHGVKLFQKWIQQCTKQYVDTCFFFQGFVFGYKVFFHAFFSFHCYLRSYVFLYLLHILH